MVMVAKRRTTVKANNNPKSRERDRSRCQPLSSIDVA
jgi:hypothetical protein